MTIKKVFDIENEIQEMDLPANPKLEEYHRELLGDNFHLFREWIAKPLRKSIRVNPIRTSIDDFESELRTMGAEPIPWCEEGFWVQDEPWGATIPHQLGYYYVQEAASMIPAEALDAQEWEIVLDVAAAPGSKTTQIAPYCNTIIANEPDVIRRKALFANINRCGVMNAIITMYDGSHIPEVLFDKILLDAPCSNIGSARKNRDILKTWSPGRAERAAVLQKRLINHAFRLLKPNGFLVYSTCTSSIEENEEVILELINRNSNAHIEKIGLHIKSHPGLLPGTEKCMRIYPWDNDTEFFFLAKILKEGKV